LALEEAALGTRTAATTFRTFARVRLVSSRFGYLGYPGYPGGLLPAAEDVDAEQDADRRQDLREKRQDAVWIGMMTPPGTPSSNAIGCERPHADQRERQHDRLEQRVHRTKRKQHGGDRIADACRAAWELVARHVDDATWPAETDDTLSVVVRTRVVFDFNGLEIEPGRVLQRTRSAGTWHGADRGRRIASIHGSGFLRR
jgi:hypothetical protein